jgi:hypothetical protein
MTFAYDLLFDADTDADWLDTHYDDLRDAAIAAQENEAAYYAAESDGEGLNWAVGVRS